MKPEKLARLQAAGWKIGSTEVSDEEVPLVALKLSLIASGATTLDIQAAFTNK